MTKMLNAMSKDTVIFKEWQQENTFKELVTMKEEIQLAPET